jgi:hypothetical protein
MAQKLLAFAFFGTLIVNPECGGSMPGNNVVATPSQNVQAITVNAGPTNDYVNGIFTSVTVCVPGTSSCQTIDGVLVDTGSTGLRILSSVLSLTLPPQMANGNPVAECNQFQDGFTWGTVQVADVTLAGERAPAVPIQVIGSPGFATIPDSCTSSGGPSENTLDTLGANGVLGVGLFRQDCGIGCAVGGVSNPGFYYACSASGCQPTIEGLAQQLQNPVWLFAHDNNGVIVELPAVSPLGATSVSGSLVFGIGTQANNSLGSSAVFTVDGQGTFTTVYKGQSYGGSFLDTGSNGIYFLDSGTTGLPLCPDTSDFYCPATPQALSAVHLGVNGTTNTLAFGVANADVFFGSTLFSAFSMLSGPNSGSFDWGVPFFYGRNVFTAVESQGTPGGLGPYWAY